MTRYHQKAIELKYAGQTYKEIEKALGGKLTAGTLADYFATDGMLYIPYLEYEARQNKFIEEEVRKDFRVQAQYASKIMRSILQQALKAGDYVAALQIVKEQLDRAGIVTIKKSEVNVKDEPQKEMTYEQYVAELTRLGIDPRTGFRLADKKMGKN